MVLCRTLLSRWIINQHTIDMWNLIVTDGWIADLDNANYITLCLINSHSQNATTLTTLHIKKN